MMQNLIKPALPCLVLLLSTGVHAASVEVTVTVENLNPANGVTFAPLRVGFHNGSFDSFNLGEAAAEPIRTIAESGNGDPWFAAFAAADAGASLGTVVSNPAGPLLPGASASNTFTVDTDLNPYFSFAAMAVPSNDFFIGNDSATAHQLFDVDGNLLVSSIEVGASEIWDAGSEIFDPAAAAFVGDAGLRQDQNSVVAFNFAELAAFNGLLTAAGYNFDSQLTADSSVYRISFEAAPVAPVPVPAALPLMLGGLAGLFGFIRRKA